MTLRDLLELWRNRNRLYRNLDADTVAQVRFWRLREVELLPEKDQEAARLALRGWASNR